MLLSGCTILENNQYPSGTGKIILSFDDGPSKHISNELLDVLDRTGTPAVFCYIGKNVEAYPEIATRAIDAGHMMVHHSYSHTLESLCSYKLLKEETESCFRLYETLSTNKEVQINHFRPPLGVKSLAVKKVIETFGFEYAHVTTFVYDAATEAADSERVMAKLKQNIAKNNGGAIVLHEMRYKAHGNKYAVDKNWLPSAVEAFILWAKSEGFEFIVYN